MLQQPGAPETGLILGLHWGYIMRVVLGVYWGYILVIFGVTLGICWGYIGGILGVCWGYIAVILGLRGIYWGFHRENGKENGNYSSRGPRSGKSYVEHGLEWVAVKELNLSYHIGKTPFFTLYTHYCYLLCVPLQPPVWGLWGDTGIYRVIGGWKVLCRFYEESIGGLPWI